MEKLKVGLFIDTWYPMVDGVIMVVDNYAKRLAKFCDVTVFTVNARGICNRTFPYKVVKCKKIRLPGLDYDLPVIDRKFKKQLKDSKLDVVHIHSPFSLGKAGVKYAKKHNIPVVATMHSQYKQDFQKAVKVKWLTNILLKKIMKVFNKCDEYYAVNSRVAEIFHEYGTDHLPLVQRNGTDMVPVKDEQTACEIVNKKFKLDDKTPLFVFLGRIIELKNIFFIAKSLKILKDKGLKFKMLYVGTGTDEKRLLDLIYELGLQNEVELTGRITDRNMLESILVRAKLMLFPSFYDTDGLVKIEAASQKTPTILVEGCAASSNIINDMNGFTAPNDINAYADKIWDVIHNDNLYEKVKNNLHDHLYVTWDDCVNEMYNKYLFHIKNKKS